jgi:O-antigen ligase
MPSGLPWFEGRSNVPGLRSLPASGGLLGFIVLCTLFLAMAMVKVPLAMAGMLVVALAIFIISFVSTEFGLYVVVFSMLLSPEFGAGGLGGGSSTTASRGVTIRAEDMLLVLLGFAWLAHMAVHKELGLVRKTPLNGLIGYYIISCFFSTSMGFLTGHVSGITGFFFVLKYVEYFVVYFIVANYLHSHAQIRRFTIAVLITAFIVTLVAIAQIPSGERVSAPFEGERGEPNTLGGYLLFVGAIAAGLMFSLENRRLKYALGGLISLMIIPFLATLSRGSYLALPFVYFALIYLNKKHRSLMIGLMIGFAALGTVVVPQSVKDRVMYTFDQEKQANQMQVGGVAIDTSTSERLTSWKEALEDSLRSPLWGFGVTGYGFLDAQYPRILVETGFIGLLLFGLLIRAVFREAFRVLRRSREPLYRGLAMGLIAGLVGILVHGVGANSFIIVRLMEPFWLVVGLVVCTEKIEFK